MRFNIALQSRIIHTVGRVRPDARGFNEMSRGSHVCSSFAHHRSKERQAAAQSAAPTNLNYRIILLATSGLLLGNNPVFCADDTVGSLMPHGFCLSWSPQLVGLFLLGNILIALAYYSIPAALWTLVRKRRDLAFNWIFQLFAAFIFLCGTTHILKLWTIWHPDYWAEGVVDLLTGLVSGFTAIVLWPLIPKAAALRSSSEWEEANKKLQEALEQGKQSEQFLRQSEHKHRSILEKTQEAFIAIDEGGVITEWNKQAEETFGWPRQDILGKLLVETIIPERYKHRHVIGMANYKRTGHGPILNQQIEIEALHRDGHEFPIELSVTPLILDDRVTFFAFLRDITKRKHSEQELAEARDQALQSSKLKSEFLANMSHEIRTPMNAIIGMSDLLSRTQLTEEQEEYAGIIRNSADALLDILNDILEYSKIEAGKTDLEIVDFEVLSIVEETAELLAVKAREKHLSFMTFVDPEMPRVVRGDPGLIRQVLLHLLSNSVKFTEEGRITVRVHMESSRQESATLKLSVEDTGIGMAPSVMTDLFTPFTQGSGGSSRKYGGTGLGLSISKRLVGLMGGELQLESKDGAGCQAYFTIPVQQSPDSASSDHRSSLLQNKRLLVLTQEHHSQANNSQITVSDILRTYTAIWGIRCDTVNSADKALSIMHEAVANDDPYEIVIVDSAKDEDGALEFAATVKKDSKLGSSKLVMLSSAADRTLAGEAINKGFSTFLLQPVRQLRLHDCLVKLLDPEIDEGEPSHNSHTSHTAHSSDPTSIEASLSPNHGLILVAEDNFINQKVALLLLQELGYAAHAVANGREALEAMHRTAYALVLMDCQMPEMDGFEATREIRKMEDLTGRHTPIIALTAHAMSFHRNECLAAGMDDYISKPVTTGKLQESLARFLPPPGSVPPARVARKSSADPTPKSEFTRTSRKTVDIDAVYSTYGEIPGRMLLYEFAPEVRRLLNIATDALAKNELELVRARVHELKGLCAATYASEMLRLCKEIERAIDDSKDTEMRTSYQQLQTAYDTVCAFLKEHGYTEPPAESI